MPFNKNGKHWLFLSDISVRLNGQVSSEALRLQVKSKALQAEKVLSGETTLAWAVNEDAYNNFLKGINDPYMPVLSGEALTPVKEISNKYNIPLRTLYFHIENGKVQFLKVGNKVLIRKESLDALSNVSLPAEFLGYDAGRADYTFASAAKSCAFCNHEQCQAKALLRDFRAGLTGYYEFLEFVEKQPDNCFKPY